MGMKKLIIYLFLLYFTFSSYAQTTFIGSDDLRNSKISSIFGYGEIGFPISKFSEVNSGFFYGAGIYSTFFNNKFDYLEFGADINFLVLNSKTEKIPIYLNQAYIDDMNYNINTTIVPINFKLRFTKKANYLYENLPFFDLYCGLNYYYAQINEKLEKLDIDRTNKLFSGIKIGYGIGLGYQIIDHLEIGLRYYGSYKVEIIDKSSIIFDGAEFSYTTITTPLNMVLFHIGIGIHTHDKDIKLKKYSNI